MPDFFTAIGEKFYDALIYQNRYKLLIAGLGNTLLIAFCATILGAVIGVVIAFIKYYALSNKKLRFLEILSDLYVAIIRGTPVVVQLLILTSTVFISVKNGVIIAIVGFGLNSGAYVSEIVRAGILAVDKGQSEAGRSLGMPQTKVMRYIIMPQAIKNILPALGNEFIVLLKETSVAGYIAVQDLTKASEWIRTNTYDSTALFIAAGIYLVLVMGMTKLFKILERRLAKSDHR